MVVSFSVSNFRSFASEETFSLVASKRLAGSHDDHTVPIPDSKESVLRTAVIYGANGAGKSNLFKALGYVKAVALRPRERNSGTGREPFRLDSAADQASSFDLQFIADNKLYRFGFKTNDVRITDEWLLQVDGGREKLLYDRVTDENGRVTIDAQGLKNAGQKLQALATVGGPQNQSFLATVCVTLDSSDYGEDLSRIVSWFQDSLILIAPHASFKSLGHLLTGDSGFNEFAGEFLKASSTGVDHLKVSKTEITEKELRSLLSEDLVAKVLKDLSKSEDNVTVVRLGEGNELLVEKTDANHYYRITIQAAHQNTAGKVVPLELSEESDGTRRLLNLMPALHHLRKSSAVYFIDEIDRSLHPILVWKFLEFFLRSCQGGQRQIIVTTHESNLLDLDLLRRDEIWFAEKDNEAATRLYSLADYQVRKDLEIRKHYLQGRFGAVPFLGNLDLLRIEHGKGQ
jgi:AAA15 family ATPase/GTPase